MTNDLERWKAQLRSWTLFLGVLQITIGCVSGIHPTVNRGVRGIVMAHHRVHRQWLLMVGVLAFLVRELRLGPRRR